MRGESVWEPEARTRESRPDAVQLVQAVWRETAKIEQSAPVPSRSRKVLLQHDTVVSGHLVTHAASMALRLETNAPSFWQTPSLRNQMIYLFHQSRPKQPVSPTFLPAIGWFFRAAREF
jgi:hypothetical protein